MGTLLFLLLLFGAYDIVDALLLLLLLELCRRALFIRRESAIDFDTA